MTTTHGTIIPAGPTAADLPREAPPLQSLTGSLNLVLSDRDSDLSHDGAPAWSAERALDFANRRGIAEQDIRDARYTLIASTETAPPEWLGIRLSVLWTLFMAGRDTDEDKFAVWLGEMARLLGNISHDILGHSIDEAIRKSRHGFVPSVGEIRRFADPLVEERELHIKRLGLMETALADPIASAARAERRRQEAAHARHIGRFEE
jgi:hypothetical protein